jgi:hypothetical protein
MNRSFTLFIVSITIILVSMLTAMFWDFFELGANKVPLAIALTIAFGMSIAGLILGFNEIKNDKTGKIIVALSGHILIILLFFYTIYAAVSK